MTLRSSLPFTITALLAFGGACADDKGVVQDTPDAAETAGDPDAGATSEPDAGASGEPDAGAGGVDAGPSVPPSTIVSLSFDDTTADHADAAALLEQYGMRGTFYINSPRIDRPGYLSLAELTAMAEAGHEIGGHTLTHARLTDLTLDEAEAEICDDRMNLVALGFDVTTFAWPFGADSPALHEVPTRCGYVAARDVGGLRVGASCASCPPAESLPPPNAFSIRTPGSVRSTTTVATLKELVLAVEADGGGWLPLVLHRICDGCSIYGIRHQDLEEFLSWLSARADTGTVVRTFQEALDLP
jgi:peptidoglycan/xylan/chitin deacetylase (PgdA/CDA1 family)